MTSPTYPAEVSPAPGDPRLRLRVAVVNGSASQHSKTMGLVDVVLEGLEAYFAVEHTRVDVYRQDPSFAGAVLREDVSPEVERGMRDVESADLLIAAVPVYRGSYPGLFKHFFDLIDQYALANKPVLLVATGGTDRHALMIEHALRPLFGFFQALTVPVAFYASAGDFDGTTLLNPETLGRIEMGLSDVVDILAVRAARQA